MVDQLVEEVRKGESVIGIDASGSAIRVVSVAKPICLDRHRELMLVELFQVSDRGHVSVRCKCIAEKFNPDRETVQVACSRAFREEIGLDEIDENMFSKKSVMRREVMESLKYLGLNCEYHLHYCIVSNVDYLKDSIPSSVLFPFHEQDGPNPKTIFWCWIKIDNPARMTDVVIALIEERLKIGKLPKNILSYFLSSNTPGIKLHEEFQVALQVVSEL